jgi:NADH:ubiquinone oxidoreductase subunit E
MKRLISIQDFENWQTTLIAALDDNKPSIRVCDGTGCRALGSQKVLAELTKELKEII